MSTNKAFVSPSPVDGIINTNLGIAILNAFGLSSEDYGNSVIVQPDGKIILGGSVSDYSYNDGHYSDFGLVRYNPNGSLDTTFSNDGKVTTDIGNHDSGKSVAMQADGKILLGGGSYSASISTWNFTLVRYNSDGSLDTSFDGDGKVFTGVDGFDSGVSVAVQADGKILLGGDSWNFDHTNKDFTLVRYNSDGSLDTSFDGDGKVITDVEDFDSGMSVAVQADGKILLGGASYSDSNTNESFTLVRYNTNGSLDTGFSDDGIVVDEDNYGTGQSVTLQADGKILLGGIGLNSFALARYNPDGSLDTSFSGDGRVTTDFGGYSARGYSVTMQADGKILLGGDSYSTSNSTWNFTLVRYNSDGSLDTSFDGDGKVITDVGGFEAYGRSVAVQADGKILLGGWSRNISDSDFILVRYNADGSLDATFNGSTTVNHAPAGDVNITGTTIKGQTLTASNTLTDADGLGVITYQWQADSINLGTGNSYTLTANEIGKTVTVTASYTDLLGTVEHVNSAATLAITDVPVSGTAGVSITGSDFITSEQGDTAVFSVKLNSAPTRDVSIDFTSSDTTEGVITNPTLKFTAANWSTAQTFTVTGQNDNLVDGDVAYSINAKLTTLDIFYKSVTANSLTLTNQDTPIAKVETITGTNGMDVLQGTSVPSYLLGEAGDDDLSGGAGNDTIYGSYGNDLLFGEDGNDKLYGEQDADYMEGGNGNDTLDGGLGLDTLIGGTGNDTYYLGYDEVDVIDDQGLATDIDTVIMPYQLTKYTLPKGIEQGTIAPGTGVSNPYASS